MDFTVCFFEYTHNNCLHYPCYDGVKEIIKDSVERLIGLRGKQQLVVRRYGECGTGTLILYNYVLNEKNESFGIALFKKDKYPNNIRKVFLTFGNAINEIVQEGKILHFDKQWHICLGKKKFKQYDNYLRKHIDALVIKIAATNLSFYDYSSDYYQIPKSQMSIFKLSDNWSVSEALKSNNIVVFTEVTEEENINDARNIFSKQKKEIEDKDKLIDAQNKRIKELEASLRKSKKGKKKEKHWEIDWYDILLIILFLSILFNLIVPWFIPGLWAKLAVVLTVICVAVLLCLGQAEPVKRWWYPMFRNSAVTIGLSTLFVIFELIWGFPQKQTQNSAGQVLSVTEKNMTYSLLYVDSTGLEELNSLPTADGQEKCCPSQGVSLKDENDNKKNNSQIIEKHSESQDKLILKKGAYQKQATQVERFRRAQKDNDWKSMKDLADEGYAPAYVPLAKHYKSNPKQHGLAKQYALKAKKAGISGADEILNYLEDLDF